MIIGDPETITLMSWEEFIHHVEQCPNCYQKLQWAGDDASRWWMLGFAYALQKMKDDEVAVVKPENI